MGINIAVEVATFTVREDYLSIIVSMIDLRVS